MEDTRTFESISWQINKQEDGQIKSEFYSGMATVLMSEIGRVITERKTFQESMYDLAENPLFEGQDIIKRPNNN